MHILLANRPDAYLKQVGESAYLQHLGLLVTPRVAASGVRWVAERGGRWAADNDAYNGFDRDRFLLMLKAIRSVPGCLFVAAPDVVADATTTLRRFSLWNPVLHYLGFPTALVAQDGLETLTVPWEQFECLFIGGSTGWKLSWKAITLAHEAKRRGKWVHLGRVNTVKRLKLADLMKADSVDGSGLSRFSQEKLPRVMRYLDGRHDSIFDFS